MMFSIQVRACDFALDERTLWRLQRGRCYLCPGKMQGRPTRDHVWPRILGGTFIGNKLLAHSRCNSRKGQREPYPCELLYRDIIYEIAAARR